MTPGFSYAEDGPTADLTVDTWGETLEDVFRQAAIALFNAMTPIEGIGQNETREFKVEGDDLGALLFNFLDELLYLHEVDLIVFSGFDLEIDRESFILKATCHGELFDLSKHTQGIAVKAVTFHQMNFEETDEGWALRVVLDT
jgi:SHS2 domain-containing protein